MTDTTITAPVGADLRHDFIFLLADGSEYDLSGATVSVVLTPPRGSPVTLTVGSGLIVSGYDNRVSVLVDKATKADWLKGLWHAEVRAVEGTDDNIIHAFYIDVCAQGVPLHGETTVAVGTTEVTLGSRGPSGAQGIPGVPFPGDGDTVTDDAPLFDLGQAWNDATEIFTAARINVIDTASMAASLLLALQVNGVDQFMVGKGGDLYAAGGAAFGAAVTVDGAAVWTAADFAPADFAAAVHGHAIGEVTGLQAALDLKLDAADFEPADFAAAVHGHAIGEVAGLQAALDLKLDAADFDPGDFAAAAHSHVIADVTGLQTALDAKLASADYTAADVLAKLVTVDGAGSGLDADTLDGLSSAAFAAASHTHAWADIVSGVPTTASGWLTDVVLTSGDQTVGGAKAFSSPVLLSDGSAAAPGLALVGDPDTGLFGVSGTKLSLAFAGSERLYVSSTSNGANVFIGAGLGIGAGAATADAFIVRDASDALAMRRGVNAQLLRIYNTWTDASNYERGVVRWNAGAFEVGTEKAGTGAARAFGLVTDGTVRWYIGSTTGHWLANVDNTYNIGANGANRPANIYLAGSIFVGGGSDIQFTGRSLIKSLTNGNLTVYNAAGTDFGLFQFGGATASFPAWKRSTTGLIARLADDSADTWLQALVFQAANGSATAPSFAFHATPTSGFYSESGTPAISRNGVLAYQFGVSIFGIDNAAATVRFGGDAFLLRAAANTLAMRNGVNAQAQRWYNTYTDGSNYEYFETLWSSNAVFLRTVAAGTGVARNMNIGTTGSGTLNFYVGADNRWRILSTGHLQACVDNTYDIGASGATRPRTIYAGTIINSAGAVHLYSNTGMPAGGVTNAGLRISNVSSFGVFFGSGAPTLSAAKGSLYLRSDGSGTGDRAYINTDGGTTWTALTTAA